MEQFDTDEKLIVNKKDEKKQSTVTCTQFLLIAICSLISLCALYCLFKSINTTSVPITHSFDISK